MLKSFSAKIVYTLLGVLIVTYATIPLYAPTVASYFLSLYDIKLHTLKLDYPSSIKRFSVSEITVSIPDLGLINFSKLLVSREKNSINISVRRTHFDTLSQNTDTASKSPSLIQDFLPSKLLPTIPNLDIDIDHVSINNNNVTLSKLIFHKTSEFASTSAQLSVKDGDFLVEADTSSRDVIDLNLTNTTRTLSLRSTHKLSIANDTLTAQSTTVVEASDHRIQGYTLSGKITDNSKTTFPSKKTLGNALKYFSISSNIELLLYEKNTGEFSGRVNSTFEPNKKTDINNFNLTVFDAHENTNNIHFTPLKNNNLGFNELSIEFNNATTVAYNFNASPFADTLQQDTKQPLHINTFIDKELAGEFEISNLAYDETLNFDLKSSLKNTSINNHLSETKVLGNQSNFNISANIGSQYSELTLSNSSNIVLDAESLKGYGLKNVRLSIPDQKIKVNIEGQTFSPVRFDIGLTHNQIDEVFIIKTKIEKLGETIKTQLESQDISYENYRVPGFRASTSTIIEPEETFNTEFIFSNTCDETLISATWTLSPHSSLVTANIKKVFSENNNLKHWLNMNGLPMDILSGELNLTSRFDLIDNKHLDSLEVELKDAHMLGDFGSLEGVHLKLISTTLDLPSRDNYPPRLAFEGGIEKANIGPIANNVTIEGNINLGDPTVLVLKKFNIPIYDGLININSQIIELSDELSFFVDVDSLDLKALIDSQAIEGLRTTGVISGRLPVLIKNGDISVSDGKVANNTGGNIQYLSSLKDTPGLNEQLELTLDVLENFNYDFLNTDVEYTNGDLVLRSKISGKNIDVANGQKIELNLNAEMELLPALEVMRLQSDLHEKLEKRSRENQDSPKNTIICRSGRKL
ncbi:MAG: hypothetical protein ACI93R_003627 [Flavobacteriales bacterium]